MSERKNVLLLSMSTMPGKDKDTGKFNTSIYCHGEDFYCYGTNQLEPGVKYFIYQLSKKKEKIDAVIVVNTSKTFPQNGETPNAYDIWKNNITKFIQGEHVIEHLDYKKGNDEELQEKCESLECKKMIAEVYHNELPVFLSVKAEGDDYSVLAEVCRKMKEIESDGKINLYAVLNGGFRNTQFMLNAVIQMLRLRGIQLKESVTISYKKGEVSEIVSSTVEDIIQELVAGMLEFKTTGRADGLQEYYQRYQEARKLDRDAPEKEIIEGIESISKAILLCDMNRFEKALDDFAEKVKIYQEQDTKKDQIFQIFVEDLVKDYQENKIFEKNRHVINEIKWCISKKLYQQALTLVESKMATVIVDEGILYVRDKGNSSQKGNSRPGIPDEFKKYMEQCIKEKKRNIPPHELNGKVLKDERRVFVKYFLGGATSETLCRWAKNELDIKKIKDSKEFEKKVKELDRKMNTSNSFLSKISLDYRYVDKKWESYLASDYGTLKNAMWFVDIYLTFCIIRNQINHAAEYIIPTDNLKKYLKIFVNEYDRITRKKKS